jgi:hypothetical protein
MTKERVVKESKEYLQYAHETLRKAFRSAPAEESVPVNSILESIEKNVNQLEMFEEALKTYKAKKDKRNQESIIEIEEQ